MKDRICAIMKHMGMSQKTFAEEICISPGTLSSIFSGRNKPTLNTLNNIHERFPEVNMDWLMNGKGEMFTSDDPVATQNGTGEVGPQQTSSPAAGLPLQADFANQHAAPQQVPSQMLLPALDGKIFDKPSRKIAEIRVFYDDGTYETFAPK